jgi:ABC-type sugar transport system permease subunit
MTPAIHKSGSAIRRNEMIVAWLFSSPAIILLLVFLAIPFLMAIYSQLYSPGG